MAETTFESSFVFDIYSDAAALRSNPSLPGGPCNFVELAHGANGATCGCRRFWSRSKGATQAKSDETMWCMCSHHACFHDDVQAGQVPAQAPVPAQQAAANATATAAAAGQENERPKGNREPLSPVQDLASFQLPSNLGLSLDLPALENIDASICVTSEDIAKLLEAQGDAPPRARGRWLHPRYVELGTLSSIPKWTDREPGSGSVSMPHTIPGAVHHFVQPAAVPETIRWEGPSDTK